MGEQRHGDEGSQGPGTALKRRGILAGAAAIVAGIVARQTTQPVAAASDGQALVIATANTESTAGTSLTWTGGTLSSGAALAVSDGGSTSSFTAMVAGTATGGKAVNGVYGQAVGFGSGVFGTTAGFGVGVSGTAGKGGTGVQGSCLGSADSYGVYGLTDQGRGVVGSASDPRGNGVFGYGGGVAAGDGNGVFGFVSHPGATTLTAGVFGDSTASYGVLGRTTAASYSGCTGVADGPNKAAFAGAGTNGAFAAYFVGPSVVQGDFTVVGGMKNAAVAHPDGSHRLLHCVEAPEPWFEDVGEGLLVGGQAKVRLDPDFAALVTTESYHVFLTDAGVHAHLTVTGQTAQGFTVESAPAGAGGRFHWRVMAKRKDVKAERLARFELPKVRVPQPHELPDAPPPPPPRKP